MSTYNDFLNAVSSLKPTTIFAITYDWCTSQGLNLTPSMAKSWGRKFATDYLKYNTKCLGRGTDNHKMYEKT